MFPSGGVKGIEDSLNIFMQQLNLCSKPVIEQHGSNVCVVRKEDLLTGVVHLDSEKQAALAISCLAVRSVTTASSSQVPCTSLCRSVYVNPPASDRKGLPAVDEEETKNKSRFGEHLKKPEHVKVYGMPRGTRASKWAFLQACQRVTQPILRMNIRPRPSFLSGFLRVDHQAPLYIIVQYGRLLGEGALKKVFEVSIRCFQSSIDGAQLCVGPKTLFALSIPRRTYDDSSLVIENSVSVAKYLQTTFLARQSMCARLVESDSGEVGTLTTLCDKGTLEDYLKSRSLTSIERMRLCYEIVFALSVWHMKFKICHLDLKTTNIMMRTGRDGKAHPIIGDFDTVQTYATLNHKGEIVPTRAPLGFTTYPAPEMIRCACRPSKYELYVDGALDTWALGEILHKVWFEFSALHSYNLIYDTEPNEFLRNAQIFVRKVNRYVQRNDSMTRCIFSCFLPASQRIRTDQLLDILRTRVQSIGIY